MMKTTILLIEDEAAIRQMLIFALEAEGFHVSEASTAEKAWSLLVQCEKEQLDYPELILLDWMLPGASGLDFSKRLKRHTATAKIPVIMLTARGEEDDRVRGLESGADDYVVKPFSPRELIARIKAVLRRRSGESVEEILQIGVIKMDLLNHQVLVKGEEVKLGPTEYKLLKFFLQNKNRVFTRAQLLDSVWGHQVVLEERTVDVHIRRLRKALAKVDAESQIQTVRGAGYRLSQ
ncbi:MAG TPA: phosphate regulon transcriptional regulatory protein PhoB [Aeromonadales bacterium]|nr:phosphate regulon transcriptional regulatory protein PhoB [Aeromonadales bacterium]